jgi:hypothetical protein
MPSPGRAVFSLSKPNSARVLENGAFADGKRFFYRAATKRDAGANFARLF